MARELLETEALGDLSRHVPSDSISIRSIAISLKRIADKLDAIPISSDFGHDLRAALHNAGQDFAAGMRGVG